MLRQHLTIQRSFQPQEVNFLIKKKNLAEVAIHTRTCNPSTQDAEAGGFHGSRS